MIPLIAAGAAVGGIGAFLGGKAGDLARQRLEKAANMAPLDIDKIIGENQTTQKNALPKATELGRLMDLYNAEQATLQRERMLPGYGEARDKYMANVQSDMAGTISPDVESAIFRAGAGKALMGGYSGGQLHRNLAARDLGLMSDAIIQRGKTGFVQGVNTIANVTPLDILRAGFMGPTNSEALAIRQREWLSKQNIMAQAAGIKGMTGAYGDYLSNVGGMLMGGGLMGGGGAKPASTPYMGMPQDPDPSWA